MPHRFLHGAALAVGLCLTPLSAVGTPSQELSKSIYSAIRKNARINSYQFEIDAKGGTVWLRGNVTSAQERAAVMDIVRATPGVLEVHDELGIIEVAPSESSELARAVQARIKSIARNTNHAVTIVVHAGSVTLSGTLNSQLLKDALERAARETPGVTSVTNDLMVRRPPDRSISERVRDTLSQDQKIHVKALSVDVQDGIVTISGIADSQRSIEHAVKTALLVDGVEDVRSRLINSSVNLSTRPKK